jgi:hypothetical protein
MPEQKFSSEPLALLGRFDLQSLSSLQTAGFLRRLRLEATANLFGE